ncbi:uncharacterized protein LOC141718856 [Apium graveolens]|uniref:uncharacterized protein LOC141718856 n=1 Tax=Apium graveolens TaxID=4045 RepID=UPI003D7B3251
MELTAYGIEASEVAGSDTAPIFDSILNVEADPKDDLFFPEDMRTHVRQQNLKELDAKIKQDYFDAIWNAKCAENGYLTTSMNQDLENIKVCDLMEDHQRKWDVDILNDLFNSRDVQLIKNIRLPSRDRKDSWLWFFDAKGEFTGGRLPTGRALLNKRVNIDGKCPWCRVEEEDENHVLFECQFAKEVPQQHWVKINIDAAIFADIKTIGIGGVIRDANGRFLKAMCKQVEGSWSPREAEALGLKEVLSWTKQYGFTQCVFETDSKLLADTCNGSSRRSYFHNIVRECVELIKHFENVLVRFVHRSTNEVAHMLARVSLSMSDLQEWDSVAPSFLSNVLTYDLN